LRRTPVSSSTERADITVARVRPRLDEDGWFTLQAPTVPGVWRRAVEIDVADEAEGDELVESLWRHGLPAVRIEHAAGWRVEVRSPRERRERLLADVDRALGSWLADAGRTGARRSTVRALPTHRPRSAARHL
jgi:hypothetical protein